MVLQTVELFAVANYGPDGAFLQSEKDLIQPALAKLIQQYGGLVEQYSGLMSLVPLTFGVVSYVRRLNKADQDKTAPVQVHQNGVS